MERKPTFVTVVFGYRHPNGNMRHVDKTAVLMPDDMTLYTLFQGRVYTCLKTRTLSGGWSLVTDKNVMRVATLHLTRRV